SIDPNTPVSVNHGSTTAFTITPDVGYSIDGVGGTCGGSLVDGSFTTNAVTADCTVEASFTLNTYTLTYTAGANGSIDGDSPQTVNHGEDGSAVEAVPDTGYHFVQWSDESTDNPRTDAGVQGDITVEASFAINAYVVTTTAVNGTITSVVDPEVGHGQTTTVTGEADADHYFASVSGCGGEPQSNTDQSVTTFVYETGEVTAACEVTASFLIRTESSTSITGIDPPASQAVGQAYMVSVAVEGVGPTGTVTVSDGDASCDAVLAAGTGSCELVSTTVGAKSITASYPGDGNTDPSDAVPVPYEIVRIETTLDELDADSGFPDFRVGDNVTFSWTLSAASTFGTLDGDVTVGNGTDQCSAAWSAGSCEMTLTVGGPALTFDFSYPGNDWYAPSANGMTLEVLETPREITLDAAIRKRVTASLVLLDNAGDLVRFELLVQNLGGDPIVGAQVVDMLPDEMVVSSWTCEEFDGGECANASGMGDLDELVNLPLGASVRFLVEGLLDSVPDKGVVNIALVVAEDDVDESNNESGTTYQRCTASNLQTDPLDEKLLEHACVFRDGFEAE
ncbi:MAG TPA: Ig-like domain repeat protein, partial [Xanthomonadaceae bacterium]|nr:Ig-like domain repeat protein [Xanthomonadaceae bacterium]